MRSSYAIRKMFLTVQGEGARTGAKSVFVRFAGCNLWDGRPEHRARGKGACAQWCDTDFVQSERMASPQILEAMDRLWPRNGEERWCVVTGGEPMLQLDRELVEALQGAEWRVAIETNGTLDPVTEGVRVLDLVDHIACSPKRGAELAIRHAHELKVVLPGDMESPWTESELLALKGRLEPKASFVQPEDPIDPAQTRASYLGGERTDSATRERYQANVRRCLEFVSAHPAWRLSLQTHKYLGIP